MISGMWAPQVVTGIDIGGTKIGVGAVEVVSARVSDRLIMSRQIQTMRARPAAFYDEVAALVRALWAELQPLGWSILPLAGVAHPGRLLADGTLARGTAPNLGVTVEDFDGVNPSQALGRRLGIAVVTENDAVAQMRHGLERLLREETTRSCLLGQTVVYLGPGTGMGGGVAVVDLQGEVSIITDGHFFDLQVQGHGDGTSIAEELLTGPSIARLIADVNRRLESPIDPATPERISELLGKGRWQESHVRAAYRIAEIQGDLLALIIGQIHRGQIVKVRLEPQADGRVIRHVDEPDRAWSAADQAAVQGASRFLFGGSIGASPTLGACIRARALEQLAQRHLDAVKIFQLPGASADAGLLGATSAIPLDHLQSCLRLSQPT